MITSEQKPETTSNIDLKVLKYFQNKDIAKERLEENKLLFEDIEAFFAQNGDKTLTFELPNGEYAVLNRKAVFREKLDRDALAEELQISKDELKTPYDFSKLTDLKKITPGMIAKHTKTHTEQKFQIRKTKKKPKISKREESF